MPLVCDGVAMGLHQMDNLVGCHDVTEKQPGLSAKRFARSNA
jgi:hypothetical protein